MPGTTMTAKTARIPGVLPLFSLGAKSPVTHAGSAGMLYAIALIKGVAQSVQFLYGNPFPAERPLAVRRSGPLRREPARGTFEILAGTGKSFAEGFFAGSPQTVLRYLLELFGLAYTSDPELRRHIKGLRARYQFDFSDHPAPVGLTLAAGRAKVVAGTISAPDARCTFKNGNALKSLMFSPKPDLLRAILNQEVFIAGNLTYLYKFAFLARHLQIKITGAA